MQSSLLEVVFRLQTEPSQHCAAMAVPSAAEVAASSWTHCDVVDPSPLKITTPCPGNGAAGGGGGDVLLNLRCAFACGGGDGDGGGGEGGGEGCAQGGVPGVHEPAALCHARHRPAHRRISASAKLHAVCYEERERERERDREGACTWPRTCTSQSTSTRRA